VRAISQRRLRQGGQRIYADQSQHALLVVEEADKTARRESACCTDLKGPSEWPAFH